MKQEDIPDDTLREPAIAYGSRKEQEPYFFDPLEDVGFKRLFAAEQNQELTVAFLNHVLRGKKTVVSIEVLKSEYPGETKEEGQVTVDMVCKDQEGAIFLVEMQRQYYKNFKKRSLYYGSRLLVEQAPRGNRREWGYDLKDVYVIALLEEFKVSEDEDRIWLHDVALFDTTAEKVFCSALSFIYIEMPHFQKTEQELKSDLERWIYALKHLNHLQAIPATFSEPELVQFCEAARYINLTKAEKNMISNRTKQRWDYYAIIEGAKEIGEAEGRAIGESIGEARGEAKGRAIGEAMVYEKAVKTARKLKGKGFLIEEIAELTELSVAEIKSL
ncbi:Rpn family recombination-promoting nuclease/putative transposase [Pedobacter frigoris]|uniref:Rpn family recombination-promoting nuclease/putative transposase n=1 Tax=Pedobacter frigoris TaxID=2571272 RepID=A0A4U1CP42_9SPHI|nr:Rpn family recombination-promoting nuclease/putative transposase [Pedobacter frigoris]TKC09243.1 Rpn family recombination-promoting nuclease/putative transposase [Pedobacter frigoris]